ncbi:MAG: hypothetical protein CML24_15175 [Rhizobiales bacterium]|jgi:hypothetical protein|nr:hypothetical protein [Hyphomicrobiales bacterium]|tara:strand:+ start:273 stop:503 length:231 start_codon:yes stop_codon:yes gene_type:complete
MAAVTAAAILFMLGYTIFSEWLDIRVRKAGAHRDLHLFLGARPNPLLQWRVKRTAAYPRAAKLRPWRRATIETFHV